MSPSASGSVLPCSAVSTAAIFFMSRRMSSWSFNMMRARWPMGTLRQVLKASAADFTASATSAASHIGTRARTCCVAGLITLRHALAFDSTNWPLISSLTLGTASDRACGLAAMVISSYVLGLAGFAVERRHGRPLQQRFRAPVQIIILPMARNTKVEADHHAPPVTRILAKFVATHPSRGWDDAVDHEAHRTFLNWVGCAVGAARHASAEAALGAVRMLEPAPQSSVLGREEKVDMASAALVNGITSHTFDFDDTHLKTIIHPARPVASSLLAFARVTGASGREAIDALVLGVDVSCRMGNCIYPEHYDRGWHITGSTGMLGAAAGCARLLRLDEEATAMALGIAASQPIGMREQFGTMTKPFHPGGAARAGLTSALLAKNGFTASPRALEAPRGYAQVVSTKCDWSEITGELGSRFEISFNTYKPVACGIVIHPLIDAAA